MGNIFVTFNQISLSASHLKNKQLRVLRNQVNPAVFEEKMADELDSWTQPLADNLTLCRILNMQRSQQFNTKLTQNDDDSCSELIWYEVLLNEGEFSDSTVK